MLLLIDIGNTHTHLGVANSERVLRQRNISTAAWSDSAGEALLRKFVGKSNLVGMSSCSVVPRVTPLIKKAVKRLFHVRCLELTHETVRGVGIDYRKPKTIGPDRLANAVAARHHFGAPVVAVDFGTAVTLDVVDPTGNFIGGIIAPGLAAMTDYLHEKTALLPRIRLREVAFSIGKSTEQAMLVGALHGFCGLIHALITELIRSLHYQNLPVVVTGGYAPLIAGKLSEITAVEPLLTLEGLRLHWQFHRGDRRLACQPGKELPKQ